MLDLFQSLPCPLSYAGFFFFISGYLIRRYIDSVPWGNCLDKRIWNIFWVLALWGRGAVAGVKCAEPVAGT